MCLVWGSGLSKNGYQSSTSCDSIFYSSITSYGVCATSCPLSVSTHRKEQEPQPTVALPPCGLLKILNNPKSDEFFESFLAFVYFNLGVALLIYSPYLAGMGSLTNPLEKKLPIWETFAHIVPLRISYAGWLVFYPNPRDSVCFWELKETELGSRGTN